MAKLRVIQKRDKEVPVSAELRGLNDTELFQGSGLHGHLLIGENVDESQILKLCETYDLKSGKNSSNWSVNAFHLQVGKPIVGEHKIQALRLFVAGLEIQKTSPTTRCLLFQTSGLRTLLRERIHTEKDGLLQEMKAILSTKFKHESKFSLHLPMAITIHQAGLMENPGSSEWVHLTESQIESAHRHLTGEQNAQTAQSNRKYQVG